MCAPKPCLEIGFVSRVGWLGCTYAAVVTTLTDGVGVVWMSCAEFEQSCDAGSEGAC